jgi:hypothetical protein
MVLARLQGEGGGQDDKVHMPAPQRQKQFRKAQIIANRQTDIRTRDDAVHDFIARTIGGTLA